MRENQNERPMLGCMDTLKANLKKLGPKCAQDFHDIVHAYADDSFINSSAASVGQMPKKLLNYPSLGVYIADSTLYNMVLSA